MNIIEKINFLLLEKGLTKKEFSDSLRKLEPKLFATGEIPSEQTIYRYLSLGARPLIETLLYLNLIIK